MGFYPREGRFSNLLQAAFRAAQAHVGRAPSNGRKEFGGHSRLFRSPPETPGCNGTARAFRRDRKGLVSLIGYVAAIALAFVSPGRADLIYALVTVMWIVPDRRIAGRVSS